LTAGVGALATKAAAGLAVAAIVTAGTVEADHTASPAHHRHHAAVASTVGASSAREPVFQRAVSQPVTFSRHSAAGSGAGKRRAHVGKKAKTAIQPAPIAVAAPLQAAHDGASTIAKPVTPPVTEVTTDSTQLPGGQTQPSEPATPTEGAGTGTTTTPATETTPPSTTTTPPPPPPPAPEAAGSAPQVVTGAQQPTSPGAVGETLKDGGTPAP
jgi:hypothetical protein